MDKLKTKKNLILFMIYGFIYLNLEIVFRAFRAPLVGVLSGISVWSLASWTTLWMFLPVWLIISPVTFWIDDMTRHIIFNEPKPKKLIHYFRFK
jgi:hypothetical protein